MYCKHQVASKFGFVVGIVSIYSLVGVKLRGKHVTRGTWLKHPSNIVCILGTQNVRCYDETRLLDQNALTGLGSIVNSIGRGYMTALGEWETSFWLPYLRHLHVNKKKLEWFSMCDL